MENRPINSDEQVGRFDYPRNKPAYLKKLTILSNISEKNQLDHLAAIDWDNPEYTITDDDERWILPRDFDIGADPWYWEQPRERQIEIGKYRYAQVPKIGSEFEKYLIEGIDAFVTRPQNKDEENQYVKHEAAEEIGHTKIFDRFVEEVNPDVKGAPTWFHLAAKSVGPIARYLPVGFWQIVLDGEEPIDHTQRSLLDLEKQGATLHPMLRDIMRLHIEEEARHISFAHLYMERYIDPRRRDVKSRLAHQALSVTNPLFKNLLAKAILYPSRAAIKDMDIPSDVAKRVWGSSDHSKTFFRGLFDKPRRHADKLELRRTKIARGMWRALGMAEEVETQAS
jgi:hypothetical protein